MTAPNSFSGKAQTTVLATGITSTTQTSFTLAASGTWLETVGSHVGSALGTSGNFVICVDYGTSSEERMLCSSVNVSTGAIQVVTRGYDGTTALTHSVGATVVHVISTDVPYQANLGVTNAATALSTANTANTTANTANTTANAANTTANSALTAANTIKSNVWTASSGLSGMTTISPYTATTSITGITGYTNYLFIATASFQNLAGSGNQIDQKFQINNSGSYSAQEFVMASSGTTKMAGSSMYAYTTTPSTTFSVQFNSQGTQSYQVNASQLQVIGYN